MARWNPTTSPPLRAADLQDLLEGGLVLFPGSLDKFRNPLLFVQLDLLGLLEHNSANELNMYFNYFVSISKEDVKRNGYVLVVDCTRAVASALSEFLELLHDYFPGKINKVYVIQRPTQETYVGRAYLRVKTLLSGLQGSTDYPRITLNNYPELQRVVDPSQIPSFFDGNFNFDQKLWVETRIELEKLLADYQTQAALISHEQEALIKPIPGSLAELGSFEKTIKHLREKVYVPVQVTVSKAESLIAEERLSRSEASSVISRFRYCPLSANHVLDLKLLHETHNNLSDVNDNFLNLWGLQLQKVYLEKFTLCHAALTAKLEDLVPTVTAPLRLALPSVESQYHFYSSLHTGLLSDACKLYECATESHAALRDWTYTTTLPTDDLEVLTARLNKVWGSVTSTVALRRGRLEVLNKHRDVILRRTRDCEALHRQISSIGVSEAAAVNVALPARHRPLSDQICTYLGEVRLELGSADTTLDVVPGNIDVTEINKAIRAVLQKSANLHNLNHQCLEIKEQISVFFAGIKEIEAWLEAVGHPFICSQNLGGNLEESKQGKTKFLKFIANSGLDETKKKITQCTRTLTVILNSQFLDDRSVNIIRDTFTRTEVDWKGFGLEVQEHGRDLELSIEFYEAAQCVASWLTEEEGNRNSIIHVDDDGGGIVDLTSRREQLARCRKAMNRHSSVMDECHSTFIALSASSNLTLRHIRQAKTRVDSSWTRFSEQVRAAERVLEKRQKEETLCSASSTSVSSMESLDFETEVEHTAFRNTKLLIQELVETERRYVAGLREVVKGYKVRIEGDSAAPKVLRTNTNILFGNIEDIYNFHSKIFLAELEKSLESNSVGAVFCSNIRNFEMYATYCKNKPHSENLLSNLSDNKYLAGCQADLAHVLDLSSYLLKPVQRVMKYHLILEKLLKYAPEKRKEELHEALCIMEQVPRYANDAIHLMGLEGYHGNFEDLGQLLLQEHFLVFINGQKRPTPRQMFIFEHAILFSKPVPVKPSSRKMSMAQAAPKYSYKNHFMLSQIGLTRFLPDDLNNVQFLLNIYKKNQKHTGETYILQANNTALRDTWMNRIEQLLFLQFENMKNRAASNML